MKTYLGYIGQYGSGEQIYLHFPEYADQPMPVTRNVPQNLKADYPDVFDVKYSYLNASGDSFDYLPYAAIGFSNIIGFTAQTDIYLTANKFIRINVKDSPAFSMYVNNNIVFSLNNLSSRLVAFPTLGQVTDFSLARSLNVYDYQSDTGFIAAGRLSDGWDPDGAAGVTAIANFFSDIDPYVEPSDPYSPGGTSGTGGGDGSFDLNNDSIDFPSLPTLSAVDTGLVSIYTPTLAQLKSLATFLWNANPTDVDWWKKLVANPLDLILGLSIVPVQVPQGTTQNIKVGLIDTGVSVTKAASQFVTVDCGSVTIQKNCGGSALDFSPFTKFSLYLPFIGTRTISCDDIMGRTVHVKYNVDLLSGGCTAMVKITGGPEDNELDAILYQYSGACAISIPLTGETFTNMITSTIQLAASIGATVATGGAAAGVAAASAANSLMSMKPIIERAGGVSGAAGQLGVMIPYLIAEVPRQSVPENCNQFTGYPSNIKTTISELTGFTSVDIIHLENIPATNAEKAELESILKAGVIL